MPFSCRVDFLFIFTCKFIVAESVSTVLVHVFRIKSIYHQVLLFEICRLNLSLVKSVLKSLLITTIWNWNDISLNHCLLHIIVILCHFMLMLQAISIDSVYEMPTATSKKKTFTKIVNKRNFSRERNNYLCVCLFIFYLFFVFWIKSMQTINTQQKKKKKKLSFDKISRWITKPHNHSAYMYKWMYCIDDLSF